MRHNKLATNCPTSMGSNARGISTPRVCEQASTPPVERGLPGLTARKLSSEIELTTALDVRAALCHAIHLGLPPNRHLTINLDAAGAADPIAAIGQFLKLLWDAARKHGFTICYVWVRETAPVVGDHIHILLHVPDKPKWFAKRRRRWLTLSGLSHVKGVTRTNVIRGCRQNRQGDLISPALYAVNLRNLERYLLKYCSPDVQQALGIADHGPCLVTGKRVSISQNLHRKARSSCGLCTPTD